MARLVTPACTRAVRFSKSVSRMRFILATPKMMASSCGMAPPESDVPAPRGTTLTPCSWQNFRTADTSSVVDGSTTALAMGQFAGAWDWHVIQGVRFERRALDEWDRATGRD